MGLFDTVTLDLPVYAPALPDLNFNQFSFQTKSIDEGPTMSHYHIDIEGKLWMRYGDGPTVRSYHSAKIDEGLYFYEYFSNKLEFICFVCGLIDGQVTTDVVFSPAESNSNAQWLGKPFDWDNIP